jgi:arylformamidase
MAITQPEPLPSTGPPVWLGLDQAALDDAYDHTRYAPNREQVLARWLLNSARAREVLGEPLRLAYGPSQVERLDVFQTRQPNAPVNVFVHGGAWRSQTAAGYAMLAEAFVGAGAHCAILDFGSVEQTDGDLLPMVEQVRRAIAWVYRNAERFGGDPDRIFLSGHSSGAHLGGCLVTTDWPGLGLPVDLIKGAVLTSGMYDLRPVRLSKRSSYVRFTDVVEEALSPIRHLDHLSTPLVLSYGSYETPEFRRQTTDFHAAASAAGKAATLLVGDGYNHFEILETLANPYGLLGRAALAQMRMSR